MQSVQTFEAVWTLCSRPQNCVLSRYTADVYTQLRNIVDFFNNFLTFRKLPLLIIFPFHFSPSTKMTSGSGGGNSSLVVPMVMWGPRAPTHCISAIYLMRDQKTLVTGASDGQVILWEVNTAVASADKNSNSQNGGVANSAGWGLTPRHLLMGHTAPVKCIAKATAGSDAHHVVTSSENGEMFSWDTVDGRCLENRRHPGLVHTNIQVWMYHFICGTKRKFKSLQGGAKVVGQYVQLIV